MEVESKRRAVTAVANILMVVLQKATLVFSSLLALMANPLMEVDMSFLLRPKLESLKLGVPRTRRPVLSLRSARRTRRRVSAVTNSPSRRPPVAVTKRSITIKARGLNWRSPLYSN